MKKIAIVGSCILLLVSMFTGCGSTKNSSNNESSVAQKQTPNLIGEWKQENSKSEDSYQTAKIADNTIEIYWVTDNGDTKSLYWAGSFDAPKTADEPYSWTSNNDHSKTENSLLSSGDDTKVITYENGEISYEVTMMGTTTKVKLKKQ